MLTYINPEGPNSIELVLPQGGVLSQDGATGAPSVGAQAVALTYEQPVGPLNVPIGLYSVKGTSADEVAYTTLQVVDQGVPTEFGIIVNPDGSITIRNGQPGCSVTIFADGVPIGTVTIGEDGTATFMPEAPLTPGAVLTAKQAETDTCSALEAAPVTVGGDAGSVVPPSTTGPASTTGANVALGFTAGLAALGLGGGLYAAGRRKRV